MTAQHRDMPDQVLAASSGTPDYDLDPMTQDQSLAGLTARILAGQLDTPENIASDFE